MSAQDTGGTPSRNTRLARSLSSGPRTLEDAVTLWVPLPCTHLRAFLERLYQTWGRFDPQRWGASMASPMTHAFVNWGELCQISEQSLLAEMPTVQQNARRALSLRDKVYRRLWHDLYRDGSYPILVTAMTDAAGWVSHQRADVGRVMPTGHISWSQEWVRNRTLVRVAPDAVRLLQTVVHLSGWYNTMAAQTRHLALTRHLAGVHGPWPSSLVWGGEEHVLLRKKTPAGVAYPAVLTSIPAPKGARCSND